ncbi:hypothetical protein K7X08_030561 [Anisodus acutangulus]|uniref:Uncharacterized protein n=1 Tax=Anisodus acutangulus TaxID=402998 RepID=A0A9Q1MQV1_9SOLA|nr:hypothetical protein K7X08_030561 [Anisodus acutangulus]
MAQNGSLEEFLAVTVDAAKKAGETKYVEHKGEVDLVTETDKACEDLIFNHLKQHFPSHKLFTGIHGKGAFLNGKPIKVSSQSELVKALLATEAGTKRDKLTVDATTSRINSLLFKVRSLRMPLGCRSGAVILKEAGGAVFDLSGSEFDITARPSSQGCVYRGIAAI